MRHVPNLLTIARILLAPVLAVLILRGEFRLTLWVAIGAGLTDAFDGAIARRFGAASRLGQILDPIADKLMQACVFIPLGITGAVPGWLVWVIFGRDLVLLAGAGVLWAIGRHAEFPPSLWGKISTIIQVFTAFFVLAELDERVRAFAFSQTTVITVWSGVHYISRAVSWLRSPRNSPD